ncbi:MAG: TetR/AcrR family transcriptional regulator [Myxococcota bacterium]
MPRSPTKENVRKARSDLYRQIILEAAEGCFARKGVDDTKMEEVAAESGLSLGTLYAVFSGKAQLVHAIHARLREVLARAISVARGSRDPLEMLLLGVRTYLEFFVLHPSYLEMHLREGYAWGLGHTAAPSGGRADAWGDGIEMAGALFQRGIERGIFLPGDPRLMARMMIAMQQVQLATWLESGETRDPGALLADIETQLRRSFCARPAA